MTISSENRKAGPFSGNGSTTVFPFAFKVFEASDVVVTYTNIAGSEEELAYLTHYSVVLNVNQDSSPGGTVTILGTPPATGEKITITSGVPALQGVSVTNLGGFYPAVINGALDRLTILVQQVREELARTLRLPVSSTLETSVLGSALLTVADWLDGGGSPLDAGNISYYYQPEGVERKVDERLQDIPTLSDFGGDLAKFQSAASGGLAVIPEGTHGIGTTKIASPGVYENASTELLYTDFMNQGEAALASARSLSVGSFTGTNTGKRRFNRFNRLSTSGPGSTVAIDGTGDYGSGSFVYKGSYSGAASAGEIGGHYTVIRQGGASATLNDCSAELYDVSTFSDSFACLTEGATSKVNSSSVITDKIRVMTGFLKKGASDMGGIATVVETGTASNIDYSVVNPGTSATRIKYHVNLNRVGSTRQAVYQMFGDGSTETRVGVDLGAVSTNTVLGRKLTVFSNNADSIVERAVRTGGGSDFTTAEWRIHRDVDGTVAGGIAFGYEATRTHTVSLTINGVPHLKIGANLSIGFNGATPITRPVLNAPATDLATAIALTNQIRAALISYGLAT